MNSVPTIGSSNYSSLINKTIPVLESFVYDDPEYTREKTNAENVILPKNVIKINPPVKSDNSIVKNYLINQKNISKVAGINANESCVKSSVVSGREQVLNICNPPDIQIAPGKYHVIEMTNNFIGVWNKSDIKSNKTVLQGPNTKNPIYWTNDFFKIDQQKNDTFDPSIVYDPFSHRWFSTVVEFEIPDNDKQPRKFDKMGIILSYSGRDNYRNWNIMKFSPRLIFPDNTIYFCPDRPMIYASSDKVVISMTVSDPVGKFCDEESRTPRTQFMAVFNKTQLLDDTHRKKNFDFIHLYDRNFHYVPVKSATNKSEINLVDIRPWPADNMRLSYLKLDGSLQDLKCNYYVRDLDYEKKLPQNAVQKGTNTKLFLADNRITDAVDTKYNETWITFHNGCNTGVSETTCIRLVKLNVDNNSPFQKCNSFSFNRGGNETGEYYEGGNSTQLDNLNLTEVPEMAENGSLPSYVVNDVVSKMVTDPSIAPIIINEAASSLKKITPNDLNYSEVYELAANSSLSSPVADDVVSKMVTDPDIAPVLLSNISYNLVSNLMIKRDLDFQIGSDNYYYYFPTLALSKNGSLVVYFGISSKDTYPSLGLLVLNSSLLSQSGKFVNGTLKYDSILVKNGTAFAQEESITDGVDCSPHAPCTRFGDYFSITADPFDNSVLWAAGEYYDSKYFSTIISTIRLR